MEEVEEKQEPIDLSKEFTQDFPNTWGETKEESQPQEDIELLPAYEPRAEDMSHDSATFDPAEWQLKLITDRLNQLIKANKK